MMIALNEGTRAYLSSKADARAAQELWRRELEQPPTDFDHAEVRAYNRAWMAAQAIKIDLFEFLSEVAAACWIETVREAFPAARMLTIEDMEEEGWQEFKQPLEWLVNSESPDEHLLVHSYALGSELTCQAAVRLTTTGMLSLWCYADTEDRVPTSEVSLLPPAWVSQIGDTADTTALVKIDTEQEAVDVSSLAAAANALLHALAAV